MKWTNQTKNKAIELLKKSVKEREIAQAVGMSESSVILLKSKVINNYSERIRCEICGIKLKQISNKHLQIHNMSLDDYKLKFPNAQTRTSERIKIAKNFKNPNKGKTYDEIYGAEEALKKRKIISEKQIGRVAPKKAGRGLAGTRKDTEMFARSTWEANIDRIFKFENKRVLDEFDLNNPRENLIDVDGEISSYQPDRVDVDGLFHKGAYLEIKGYMTPDSWKKICLFRKQRPDKKLLVISNDDYYKDISYKDLKDKYADKIPLWEDYFQNYKTRPDLYKIGYVLPKLVVIERKIYPKQIHKDIIDVHKKFIAKKCISYNKVAKGARVLINSVELMGISNKRKGARKKSSGRYNYEMWKVATKNHGIFYVGNIDKTTVFYCYEDDKKLVEFFKDNNFMELSYGKKEDQSYENISDQLMATFHDKFLLGLLNNALSHTSDRGVAFSCVLVKKKKTKRGSARNFETWEVKTRHGDITKTFHFSNFDKQTTLYSLRPIS